MAAKVAREEVEEVGKDTARGGVAAEDWTDAAINNEMRESCSLGSSGIPRLAELHEKDASLFGILLLGLYRMDDGNYLFASEDYERKMIAGKSHTPVGMCHTCRCRLAGACRR